MPNPHFHFSRVLLYQNITHGCKGLVTFHLAVFPHVLELSGFPPVPNPILETHHLQSVSLLTTKPILALKECGPSQTMLNPSLLHLECMEAF